MKLNVLIYTNKVTPRIRYVFKHIFTRVFGLSIDFTTEIEVFVAYDGPKFSYTLKQLGNELHFSRVELLFEQGINNTDMKVEDWKGVPCFFNLKSEASALPYDVFAATFYLLSRYEEYLPHVKDALGRFPSSESLAGQNNFLKIPLVDKWITRIQEVFEERFPNVIIAKSLFETNLTVRVPQVFAYKKIGFLRGVGGYVQDITRLKLHEVFDRTQVILGVRKDPYDIFTWLVNFQKQIQKKFTILFEVGDQTSDTTNVRYSKVGFQSIIKMMGDYCNVGLLASVVSSKNNSEFKKEKNRLESIVNKPLESSKFAKNQLTIPQSYRMLLEQEVIKDYSMGFPNEIGFRAGTCRPFLFYDLDYEMQTPLLLMPVSLPLESVINEREKTVDFVAVSSIREDIEQLNGILAISCTNKTLAASHWRSLLKKIIEV